MDMFLLDRTHLEAMLSGLFSPNDLFAELVDRASYRGEVQVLLTGLLVSKGSPPCPLAAKLPDLAGQPGPVPAGHGVGES